jgi:glycosyltransferase involved in cell wall biosynthesis
MNISVVIPCYPPHQKYIPRLLRNLENQIVRPSEVILSLSEVSAEEGDNLREKWSRLTPLPIKVATWPTQANASVNRNNGALEATGEYITFLDADDIYSPLLFYRLYDYIFKYKPMALLFQHTTEKIPFHILTNQTVKNKVIKSKELFEHLYPSSSTQTDDLYNMTPHIQLSSSNPAHGDITVKKEVWEAHPQQDVVGREDSLYVRELLQDWWSNSRKEGKEGVIILPDILMWYAPDRHHQ